MDIIRRSNACRSECGRSERARGSVIVAGTFEISGLGGDKRIGALIAARPAAAASAKYLGRQGPVCQMDQLARLWATPIT